ncbi:MAG: hypothetical protein K8S55_02500 [Phycisphaerae bacterium]|nr:hypothetical protein [Phycisphaerae bacterium]
MLSLKFFRKRQKMIFVIMVVLMISFLVGFQGINMLFNPDRGKTVIGTARDFELTGNALQSGRADVELLRIFWPGFGKHSAMAYAFGCLSGGSSGEVGERDVPLAYALLVRQAEKDGVTVTDAEVDQLINRFKQTKSPWFDYDKIAGDLRQDRQITEKKLRSLFSRWLMVFKNYNASMAVIPPSNQELKTLFRDVDEKMQLRAVILPAKDFLKEIKTPTDKQIDETFEKYKARLADSFDGVEKFTFGYQHPPRVALDYVFVNYTAVAMSAKPAKEEIEDYINQHEGEDIFVKKVPVETPKKDKTKDDKKPDKKDEKKPDKKAEKEAPVPTRSVPMSYSEKVAVAVEKLQPAAAREKYQDIFGRIEQMVRKLDEQHVGKKAADLPNVYQQVAEKLTISADVLLKRKITAVGIKDKPLNEAIKDLAVLVDPQLAVICYPYGKHGEIDIDPKMKVTLLARNITLAEALEKITAQVRKKVPAMPKLEWACFDGIDEVIFPVTGIRFFPVTAGGTPLESAKEISEHKLLGNCALFDQSYRQRPISLAQIAMQVKPIVPNSKLEVGKEGPVLMAYAGGGSGQLIWRFREAKKVQTPEAMTKKIREQVIKDWKFAQAFQLATAKAETLKKPADLDAYVKNVKNVTNVKKGKNEPIKTGLFARKMRNVYGGGAFQPTKLWSMEFKNPAVDSYVIDEMFEKLTPKNLDAAYLKESAALAVLPLKAEGCVVVAQRINFIPALAMKFELEKKMLIESLQRQQYQQAVIGWFSLGDIVKRTGFKPTEE